MGHQLIVGNLVDRDVECEARDDEYGELREQAEAMRTVEARRSDSARHEAASAERPSSCSRHVVESTIFAPVSWITSRSSSMQLVRNISRSCFGLGGWSTPSTSRKSTAGRSSMDCCARVG